MSSEARKQAAIEARARKLGIEPWQLEMAEAVGDDVLRDIAADARRRPPSDGPCSPLATSPNREEVKRGTGWADEIPLKSPPGVGILDRLMDAQDAQDRAERAAKAAKPSEDKK
jgi:hypothetical protein